MKRADIIMAIFWRTLKMDFIEDMTNIQRLWLQHLIYLLKTVNKLLDLWGEVDVRAVDVMVVATGYNSCNMNNKMMEVGVSFQE